MAGAGAFVEPCPERAAYEALVRRDPAREEVARHFIDAVNIYYEREISRPELLNRLGNNIIPFQAVKGRDITRQLFQSYTNLVPECEARTRNAALVEIRRSNAGGGAPAWTEYLVIVPQLDGTSRIDDVLFATRRSDTLRSRLGALAGWD